MKIVNCPYCNKPARKFYDTVSKVTSWQCDYHGSVRVRKTLFQDEAYTVTLVVIHKEEQYYATFHYNFSIGPKFQLLKVNRWPKTHQIITSMDFHPDITPENVENKLPTLILFS